MSKHVLVTGCAGFIGFHVARALRQAGNKVLGVDHFNSYYDVRLKRDRASLLADDGVSIIEADIVDADLWNRMLKKERITHVVHLAAQAGVRYARQNPKAYLHSNLDGFLVLLEALKSHPEIPLIYASSSSVYGKNETIPFSEEDRTDEPANLYAATKKSNEVMATAYHHMYGLQVTGLRFFTVYGPWGRPDMAYFSFTRSICEGRPIHLFNEGNMWRDFTYIDDIVEGTLAALDVAKPCALFNLGNHRAESLRTFVQHLEDLLGKKAQLIFEPCPQDEMIQTYADIHKAQQALGFSPKISLSEGLRRFVVWYHEYDAARLLPA